MFCSIRTYRSFIAGLVLCSLLPIGASAAGSRVKLAWDTNPEVRVAGYRVYRMETGKAQILLNKDTLLPEPHYIDTNVTKGATYRYAVSAVDVTGLESPFSGEIEVTVQPRRVASRTQVPTRLSVDQLFGNLIAGTSLVNTTPEPTTVRLYSLDSNGVPNGFDREISLGPLGGFKSLMQDLMPGQTTPATLVASGDKHSFEPVFTVVDEQLKRLDGLTGTGEISRELYFPIARQITGVVLFSVFALETTVVSLTNPDSEQTAHVKLELVDPSGKVTHTSGIEIPPGAGKLNNLQQLFRSVSIRDAYLKVTSDVPIQGFETVGYTQQGVASAWGMTGERNRSLTLPYFFSGAGAETQVRLVNLESFEVTARFAFRMDSDGARLERETKIPANGILIESVGTLLGLPRDVSQTGQMEVVTIGNSGREEVFGRVVGIACYNVNAQKAKAGARLQARPSRGYVLPALLQSAAQGYFTAMSLTNPSDSSNVVEIEALDDQGNLVREHSLVLPPNGRVVDLLDGTQFFGSEFTQTRGQLRIRGSAPLFASALVGNRTYDFLWGVGLIETDGE